MKRFAKYTIICLLCLFPIWLIWACADSDVPYNNGSSDSDTIKADDAFVLFVGSAWSNIIFRHQEHSERENNDCFICHDHGASIGDDKWNCGACHAANDPENLCDQDEDHGCIMAQCDFCHVERIGSSPSAPAIDCSGDTGDNACCIACHKGGLIASAGVLLDSAVQGVSYQTKTISNKTDAAGTFLYKDGEIVTFSIADLVLGQTLGGPIRTIVDLVEGADSATHPTVTNICKFLITLDQDGDSENGIALTQSILEEVKGRHIDFEQPIDDFSNDPDVQALLDTLNAQDVFTARTPRSLCSTLEAQTHMADTLENINLPPLVTFPGALQVSGSNGCNTAGCHSQAISVNGTYQVDEINYTGGMLNGKPVYKHVSDDYWIHWNTESDVDQWKLSADTDRSSYNHYYHWGEVGGENDYPPLGGWPSGCATFDGKQIIAVVTPLGGISGSLWLDEQVTGSYHYFDHEGDSEEGTTIQWYRCDDTAGTNDVIIAGAELETYTIVEDDLGKYLRFGVRPSSANGNTLGAQIKSGPAGPIVLNAPPVASDVTISGSAHVTAILGGSYTYTDALGDVESGTTFQWYRYSDDSGSGEEPIVGANAATYTLGEDDFEAYIKFEVTPGAATGNSPGTPVKSSIFGPIQADPLNQVPIASDLSISGAGGCVCVNSELTASYTYADAEDDPESSTVQWYLESAAGSGVFEPISGATSLSVTLSDDCDEEKNIQFAVTPAATRGNSPGTVVVSTPVQVQTDPNNQVPAVSGVSIQMPVNVESQAVGSYNFSDADGNADVSTFQWYLADTESGAYAPISGATSNIFIPPDSSYEWKYLKFAVTPRADCGNTPGIVVESAAVQLQPSLGNAYPVVTDVSINGNMRVAETLTGQYQYSDADGDPDCSTYQWYYATTQDGTYTAISGATALTYSAPDNGLYEGGYLKLGVTPIACSGNNYTVPPEELSDAVGPLDPALSNQLPVANPEITGEYFAGEGREIVCVKSISTGISNYFDAEGAPDISTYAWYVCQDQAGTNCGAAVSTNSVYEPITADIGSYLKFEVTPRSAWGNSPGVTVASATKLIEFNPNDSAPTATVYSGINAEGCLGLPGNMTPPVYINGLGASGVDGIYQIAGTARYTVDPITEDPINPRDGEDIIFDYENINGLVNGRVAYKHQDYYNDDAAYWIAFSSALGCRREWWVSDSACCRSRGGGAIANSRWLNGGSYSYTAPVGDWTDEANGNPACGNGIELSLNGGPNNRPGISGEPYVGNTLTGNYDYFDPDGDAEGQSTYRWLRSINVNGTYQPIPGATNITYTLTSQDEGYFLKFEVRPTAVTGNSPGNAATSFYAGIGPVISIPQYEIAGAGKTECNGTYYYQGRIDDLASYYYGAPYWRKWNGSSYEDIYLFIDAIKNSISCTSTSCTYYRGTSGLELFPPEGEYQCDYVYQLDLGTCGGPSDLATVTQLD